MVRRILQTAIDVLPHTIDIYGALYLFYTALWYTHTHLGMGSELARTNPKANSLQDNLSSLSPFYFPESILKTEQRFAAISAFLILFLFLFYLCKKGKKNFSFLTTKFQQRNIKHAVNYFSYFKYNYYCWIVQQFVNLT